MRKDSTKVKCRASGLAIQLVCRHKTRAFPICLPMNMANAGWWIQHTYTERESCVRHGMRAWVQSPVRCPRVPGPWWTLSRVKGPEGRRRRRGLSGRQWLQPLPAPTLSSPRPPLRFLHPSHSISSPRDVCPAPRAVAMHWVRNGAEDYKGGDKVHIVQGLQNSFDIDLGRTLDLKLAAARWYYPGIASRGDESQAGSAGGGTSARAPVREEWAL